MAELSARRARAGRVKKQDVDSSPDLNESGSPAKGPATRSIERLSHLYERPGIKLRRCHQIASALFEKALEGAHLTTPQYGALVILKEYPGINQVRLARLLGYDRSTIGSVVAHLADRGLIERKPDPTDGRGRVLTLTKAADLALQTGDHASQLTQEKLLEPLSPMQRVAFVAALDTILQAYNTTTRAPLVSGACETKEK